MRFLSTILALIIATSCFTPVALAEGKSQCDNALCYYVSPSGDDNNAGTKDAPFKTIAAAKEAVRNNPNRLKNKINVIFEEGVYPLTETINFDAKDSGAKGSPVVYKAAEGAEVIFEAGSAISKDLMKPVEDQATLNRFYPEVRDKVRVVDLTKIGVTYVPPIDPIGMGFGNPLCPVSLYTDDELMVLGRFPNEDQEKIKTGALVEAGSSAENGDTSKRPGAFKYTDERIENWKNIEDVWMWGEWYWAWAPTTTNIAKLDTNENIIYTALHSVYGYATKKPYYYFNVLEEIDIPGEYYIDKINLKLYVYPLDVNKDMYLTTGDQYMVKTKNASHIRFEGITFQGTRNDAIEIDGGDDFRFDGCTIRYIGRRAVTILSGNEHKIINSTLYNLGAGGIFLDKNVGNMTYLIPSKTLIENNHIYNFAEWVTTYKPAIEMWGVGNIARYNTIHGNMHQAIAPYGIDNVFEYNEVYEVVSDSDDSGAVYNYNRADIRNIHIRYNYFHGVGKRADKSSTGCWTIYFDTFISDQEVYGNIFRDAPGGVHLNGGQYCNVYSNLFIEVDSPIWSHYFGGHGPYDFWMNQEEWPYDRGIWKIRFPEASVRQWTSEEIYRNNYIGQNICYDSGDSYLEDPYHLNDLNGPVYYGAADDIFVDLDNNDWTFKVNHGVKDFYVPTIDEIGMRDYKVVYE